MAQLPAGRGQAPVAAPAANSFAARLADAVDNRARTFRAIPVHARSVAPAEHHIVGTNINNRVRLTAAGCHHMYFNVPEAEVPTVREYRVGPMLYDRNVTDAFDFYKEGLKFISKNCDLPPFDRMQTLSLEEVWACGVACIHGQTAGGEAMTADQLRIFSIGNIFAIGLPDTMWHDVATSNDTVARGVREIVRNASEALRADINLRCDNPDWNTAAGAVNMPNNAIPQVITSMAVCITAVGRTCMMTQYFTIFLAYTQQGNITARKLNKIAQEILEAGYGVTLTVDAIRDTWTKFGPYFNDEAAANFFPHWADLFTHRNLRLSLCMVQAANAGLTGLTLIREAIRIYPDFSWDRLAARCGEEWANFMAAHALVGDNIWYGFRKDLGIVAVRRYVSIVFCAKKLFSDVMGQQSMHQLMTCANQNIPETPFIDQLIRDFIRYRQRRQEGGDQAAANLYFAGGEVPADFNAQTAAAAAEANAAAVPNVAVADLFAQLLANANPNVNANANPPADGNPGAPNIPNQGARQN